ncbi:hypothetical protein GQX74_008661 [Glossina fuscipes]|nr:hypothetical protein GQX74_008661 [Glossina fuscipes]
MGYVNNKSTKITTIRIERFMKGHHLTESLCHIKYRRKCNAMPVLWKIVNHVMMIIDNSFEFNLRYLLNELDVNDIVWIGLMRPQSSASFMWSRDRTLVFGANVEGHNHQTMRGPMVD